MPCVEEDMTASTLVPALTRSSVRDEWIDSNDHMNSAMYFVAFRDASVPLLRAAGIDEDFVARTGFSLVQREAHIRYVRELRRGDPILMRGWIAGVDNRSVHVVTEMLHGEQGWLAASVELLYTFFDRRARKSCDWTAELELGLRAVLEQGRDSLPAEAVSRRVAVRGG